MKHNTTIRAADLELTGLSMDDWSHFIRNNEALKELVLESREEVTLEQEAALSGAILKCKLLDIRGCRFANDRAFEQMLESSISVDKLTVMCKGASHCNAVAALLRNPANVLKELNMMFPQQSNGDFNILDVQEAVRNISQSLVGNTHLKELWLDFPVQDCFSDKLCDASSIQSISNSNHTLESIRFAQYFSTITNQSLWLNRNPDKSKVIRNKILRFFFVGDFDVSPFVDMAVSVLPQVVSQIEGKDKLSAIYRLLKCIPELCDMSERTSTPQSGNKRQKIGM